MVNGPDEVWVERHGNLHRIDARFTGEAELMQTIDRIVSTVNRRVDESSPMVDARLPSGERVNVIIPPLSLVGPVLSIRRFPRAFTFEQLVRMGTVDPDTADLLRALVRARMSIVVSGGTSSGKTTLLNALSGFIPAEERIVTIEDSAELQLQQPHVISLEARPPNVEGKGQVTIRDLVRNSLRMRPDRIVVGEVRGPETIDMLQAMNTGHDGSLTTVHANSAEDSIVRMQTLASMSEVDVPFAALRDQINSAIDVIVQLERGADGRRRIVEVAAVSSRLREDFRLATIMRFEPDPIGRRSRRHAARWVHYPLPDVVAERLRVQGRDRARRLHRGGRRRARGAGARPDGRDGRVSQTVGPDARWVSSVTGTRPGCSCSRARSSSPRPARGTCWPPARRARSCASARPASAPQPRSARLAIRLSAAFERTPPGRRLQLRLDGAARAAARPAGGADRAGGCAIAGYLRGVAHRRALRQRRRRRARGRRALDVAGAQARGAPRRLHRPAARARPHPLQRRRRRGCRWCRRTGSQ